MTLTKVVRNNKYLFSNVRGPFGKFNRCEFGLVAVTHAYVSAAGQVDRFADLGWALSSVEHWLG